VVEVVSPSKTRAEIDERLKNFFQSGAQIAWVIHPENQFVEVCHSLVDRKMLGIGADLEGEKLLPGFRYAIKDLFQEWDWE
jgi:Uma2 family endonuclease